MGKWRLTMKKGIVLVVLVVAALENSLHAGGFGKSFGGSFLGSYMGSSMATATSRPSRDDGGGSSRYERKLEKHIDKLEKQLSKFENMIEKLEEKNDDLQEQIKALKKKRPEAAQAA